MYKKRLIVDKTSSLHNHVKDLDKNEVVAMNLSDEPQVLVVMYQERYFQLTSMEESYLESQGGVTKRTPHNAKDLKDKVAEKTKKIQEGLSIHDKNKVQGISSIDD